MERVSTSVHKVIVCWILSVLVLPTLIAIADEKQQQLQAFLGLKENKSTMLRVIRPWTRVSVAAFGPTLSSGNRRRSSELPLHNRVPHHEGYHQANTGLSTRLFSTMNQRPYRDLEELQETVYHYKAPAVQWYPGHIAKAERQLSETLKVVDVVVEVRDARACKATSHYRVGEWCAGKPRLVVLTHVDQIPNASVRSWKESYSRLGAERWDGAVTAQIANQARQNRDKRQQNSESGANTSRNASVSPVEEVIFIDAKQGKGVPALIRKIVEAGAHVQKRRKRRGLKERPLRVAMIGYPNVGKSALINRVLGRRRARTANIPGVTRSLQWIRVRADNDISTSTRMRRNEFELLDSPGVIPAKDLNQDDALLLAACNLIGDAAYDNQAVAAYFMEYLLTLWNIGQGPRTSPQWPELCFKRYRFQPLEEQMTGDDMLHTVAFNTCQGDPESAARKILQDFRKSRLGPICLQLAPKSVVNEDGEEKVRVPSSVANGGLRGGIDVVENEEKRKQRAEFALERAKEQGLELPTANMDDEVEDEVGRGLFDGW